MFPFTSKYFPNTFNDTLNLILLLFLLLKDVFATAMEFSKLEKVEIAGIKGKVLSHQVVEIFNEFNELYAMFGNKTYDGLDATNKVLSMIIICTY